MKKLLVLMLVLGLTSVANSTMTLQLAVNGSTDIVDSQITLHPSETIVLGIWASGFVANDFDSTYWAVVCDTKYGTVSGGAVVRPPAPSLTSVDGQSALTDGFPCLLTDEDGPYGGIAGGPGEVAPAGIYIGDLVFHCEAVGDAIIRLVGSPDFEQCAELDRLIIHQIPEPASMLLLGLGGLLLRRRK